MENQKKEEAIEHEKALFDFDHEINDLDTVAERYPFHRFMVRKTERPKMSV